MNDFNSDAGQLLEIKGMPPIPGLVCRNFRGPADWEAMAAIHQARAATDKVDPLSTLESLPKAEDYPPVFESMQREGFNPYQDMAFVDVNGLTVGFERINYWTETDGLWLYLLLGFVLPQWRNKGIEQALLRWGEKHCRELAATHPNNGKVMYGTNATSTETEMTALVRAEGYKPVFTLIEMSLNSFAKVPAEAPPLPPGIELRPVQPEHLRAIWNSVQEAYAGSTEHETPTEEAFQEFVADPSNDYSLWEIAWQGSEVVGQVLPQMAKGRGEIREVSVRPQWRRQGIAFALLTRGLHNLQARGLTHVRLHTRADNAYSSFELYKRVGFAIIKEHVRYRKPFA